MEKNEEALSIHVMAEELQLEIQSRIYSADWSSLERIAQFLKAEYEGKTKLAVEKHVAQQPEEGIDKLEAAEVVSYLEDLPLVSKAKVIAESQFSVILNLPLWRRKTRFKNCWRLALSVDNLRSAVKSGSLSRKIK